MVFSKCVKYVLTLVLPAVSFKSWSQCATPVNFGSPKNISAPSPLLQHYMTARRDSSAAKPNLYIAAKEKGLLVYDISNTNSPALLATVASSLLGNLDVNSITQSGNFLYLALGDIFNATSQKSGMAIIDINTPASPLVKSVYTYSANSGAGYVAVDGNYAYLAAMQNGVIVLDVTNKSSIQYVSRIKPSVNYPVNNPSASDLLKINARSMKVKNNVIYLCYDAGGVRVLNASNKANLTETGRYSNPLLNSRARAYNNLVLNDTLLYVAADYCGMEILNVKDTASIKQVGWWNPWKCETTNNTWLNSPGHTNEIEYDPMCRVAFMSAGRSDIMAVNVNNPAAPDSCAQFGLKTDSVGTWGLGRYNNQIYAAYISTWPLYVPFRSEWSGIKIITYNNACSTGLQVLNKGVDLDVFPNPAGESITISLNGLVGAKVSLFAVDGSLVYSEFAETTGTFVINTQHFAKGVYLLDISGAKQGVLKKRIILTD
jgi:hypothetical protein